MTSSVATASWVDIPYVLNHRASCYFVGGFRVCAIRDNSLFVVGDLECLYEFCFKRNTWTLVPWNGDAPTRRH
ncbi:hypothetical protein JG687_00014236 [Phytophthora cactorum]|uniref:Kelch-type beta propeller n=1 Tax=Phytophthora cactorum TaxID=29920 RepID=A0A329T4T4_9STRA|nr:hypothetical protein Pcac1_g3853 [Phytophthora cactorum]KAG2808941.1 hypothetical protein PC111_g16276 [Phytophthora cactorum]KAG2817967.1 hypothetical protein PC112_g12836 [Phytophthora cactorum]KAG2852128.1 hypothetical protein PC113_g15305 [Phytophthora cactorum]KAG2891448.1 hypothetical protein PC115_g19201 [Phytophthora cactorum]